MKNFGFGEKWVRRIKTCTSSAKIFVLVNGSPSAEFTPQKELRQGDPLSPFLFNIVVEGLNILIERAKELGFLKGATVGPNELKSVVCGVGVKNEEINDFVSILHRHSQKLPITYMGMPLGVNPRRKSTWNPVIEKVKNKLASWKRKMLSFAGRLTLLKLDRIQAAFLWDDSETKKKFNMVNWNEVSTNIDQGGLGVRNLREVNDCLLLNGGGDLGKRIHLCGKILCVVSMVWLGAAWEEEEVPRLYDLLREAPSLSMETEDSCKWVDNPIGSFTVAVAWKWCMSLKSPTVSVTKELWNNVAPPKVKFCGWLAWRARLKTVAVLMSFGVLNEESNALCLLCKTEESV
ncbi:uncharacterized protein LOC114313204 [Camellia sinensis]|uniref:uncharacterized protein LOC114313204 n=1 Tax=Camellia sinensis TaxID=4442 RepID=UPI0010358F67|nr:uncharacterized protein LOC114313204 [Camellia sinensis]